MSGRFLAQPAEVRRRDAEEHAGRVGDGVGDPGAAVEEGDLPEHAADVVHRDEDFVVLHHDAQPDLPVEHEEHRVAGAAHLHDRGERRIPHHLAHLGKARELLVRQFRQHTHAAEGAGFDQRLGIARFFFVRVGGFPEQLAQLGDVRGVQPAVAGETEDPAVGHHPLVLGPLDQRREIHRPVADVVHGKDLESG
jgi:hypothetical protein